MARSTTPRTGTLWIALLGLLLVFAGCGGEDDALAPYDVVLLDAGPNRVHIVKLIREVTDLGLADAEALMDAAPQILMSVPTPEEAERIRDRFLAAGAKARVE